MSRVYSIRSCIACGEKFQPIGTRDVWCSIPCRFWNYVDKSSGPDKCWPWMMGLYVTGYGQFSYEKKHFYCHRIALELSGTIIPEGHYGIHKCDNRKCCNPHPKHVIVGTPTDNINDMYAKGRQGARNYATGDRHGMRIKAKEKCLGCL